MFKISAFRFITIRSLWIALMIVDFLIFVRVILMIFGANPMSPIVLIWYAVSGVLLLPFFGIFQNPSYGGNVEVDLVAIVAIFIYTGLFFVAMIVISLLSRILRKKEEVQQVEEKQEQEMVSE